jgi:hypothetical protein
VSDPAFEAAAHRGEPVERGGVELVELDRVAGPRVLRRARETTAAHPRALIPGEPVRTAAQRAALRDVAAALLTHGVDGRGRFAAARQLLARRPPRLVGPPSTELRRPEESAADAVVRVVGELDGSYLPVQGPPGSGKTFTAARAIVERVRAGQRVGVTAVSHNVIGKLVAGLLEEAGRARVRVRVIQKPGDPADAVAHADVRVAKDNAVFDRLMAADDFDVVAGTAWLFAREELREQFDVLVIDEAGQLSLADAVAVSTAAANVVLVGDPRQLAQPSTGTHPDGAGASALGHVLDGRATVPDDRGVFLDETWRLHPAICAFISEQVYEGRLQPRPGCERQAVGPGPLVSGSGIRWLPVEHQGNRTSSTEEAAAVQTVVGTLLGRPFTDRDGVVRGLGVDDVLVVAPYNAQVHLLAERLPPGVRVGTVDRFQGHEAPVVVVSLAASSADDIPRGMEFLYSRNRLNVAVSRAQALCVLVASPALLAVPCRTVEQMRLANVLCRAIELAEEVVPG